MARNEISRTIDTGVLEQVGKLVARRTELRRTLQDREDIATRVSRARRLARDAAEVTDLDAAERVIGGANEMVHVHFFERGMAACRSVARVSRVLGGGSGRLERRGSGFLISPRLLVTNDHVLPAADYAARCIAEFEAEYDARGDARKPVSVELRPDVFFEASPYDEGGLDVAVVALEPIGGDHPGQVYGYLPLVEVSDPVTLGEFLNVVQHPGGEEKQVSFRENRLLERRADTLWYESDTHRGSSGSPVLNDQWLLVGVHRRSVPMEDERGNPLNTDGSVHERGSSEENVHWIANECVRVERVRTWLADLPLDGERAALRDECLSG